jgi:hypothetical protein
VLSEYRRAIGALDERSRDYESTFLSILAALITLSIGFIGIGVSHLLVQALGFSFGVSIAGIAIAISMYCRMQIVNDLREAAIERTVKAENIHYSRNGWEFAKFTTYLQEKVPPSRHRRVDKLVIGIFVSIFLIVAIVACCLALRLHL